MKRSASVEHVVEGFGFLVSRAYLWLTVHLDDPDKVHKPKVIEDVANAQVVAVTGKVVPLVNVDAVLLVCNNLI